MRTDNDYIKRSQYDEASPKTSENGNRSAARTEFKASPMRNYETPTDQFSYKMSLSSQKSQDAAPHGQAAGGKRKRGKGETKQE